MLNEVKLEMMKDLGFNCDDSLMFLKVGWVLVLSMKNIF